MRPAIRVDGLSKHYRVSARQRGYTTLRESIAEAFWSPLKRLQGLGLVGKAREAAADKSP